MYKILFIDDEKSVLQYLPMAVDWNRLGITEMRDAANGKEGLQVMEEFDPDIVIVDVEMPVMNGITFCQEVRKKNTKVKIVILSAFDKFDYVKNALKYDVNNYLLKPIDEEELEQSIKDVLGEICEDKKKDTELEQLKMQGLGKELQEIYDCFKERRECKILLEQTYPFLSQYPDICVVRCAGRNQGDEFYTILKKCLSESTEFKSYPVYINAVFTVIFARADEKKSFGKYLEKIDSVLLQQGVSLVYTYSSEQNKSISEKILQGMRCTSFWFYNNDMRIIAAQCQKEDITELPAVDIRSEMEELENTAKSEGLRNRLQTVIKDAVKKSVPPEVMFNFIMDTFISIKIYLVQYQEEEFMDVFRKVNFERFMMCRNVKEMMTLIEESINSLEEKAESFYNGNEGMYIVRKAKIYTRDHYSDSSLTLQDVADYAGISKNYLSKIFKETVGRKYWDFLTEYRIEQAKKLLRETNMSQGMICEKIGYQSEYHFSRKFKELTGVSPNKYRNYETIHQ